MAHYSRKYMSRHTHKQRWVIHYHCPVCGLAFPYLNWAEAHFENHTPNSPSTRKESDMEHTPTPWSVHELPYDSNSSGYHIAQVLGVGVKRNNKLLLISHNGGANSEGEDAQANAAFIVLAVNSFHAMKETVEAGNDFVAFVQGTILPAIRSIEGGQATIDQAWEKVIAWHPQYTLAKGE